MKHEKKLRGSFGSRDLAGRLRLTFVCAGESGCGVRAQVVFSTYRYSCKGCGNSHIIPSRAWIDAMETGILESTWIDRRGKRGQDRETRKSPVTANRQTPRRP